MKSATLLITVLLLSPALAVAEQASPPDPSSPYPAPCTPHPESAETGRANASDYSDVLLLINNQSQISMQVGNYFKQKRSVPDRNVCNISMPTSEWISTGQFASARADIENFISSSGLNNTLDYIVTTKGCPLGVSGGNYQYASFMDELGLILGPYAAAIGGQYWITNPFGGSEERFSRQREGIFIVTRLDGYDLRDCLRVIDNAANATGSRGTFVLDSQPWKDGTGYQEGNDWCRAANRTLTEKGWRAYLDDTPWYVVNQKNVSGYSSWGSNDGNAGNNAKPNFTWVPGALGTTYVSTSARSFAYPPSYGQSLIADLVREGITGVHGNVAEPFLGACSRPQYFLERYTRGWNLGESFYAGMATQSWQNCIIGDPKVEAYSDQPDPAVLAADIAYSEAALVEGMVINITARVRNLGGGPARDTTAAFYNGEPGRGGTQIGQDIGIALIPPGGNVSIAVPWDLGRLTGSQAVYVCITASNATPQLWDGNDRASRNATIFARPDLVLVRSRFTVSHQSPLEGTRVWLNATVRNNGAFVASSLLRFWMDDNLLSESEFSLLGSEETRVEGSWDTTGSPGTHRLRAEAVPALHEANLTNNDARVDVFVRRFGLELWADRAALSCLPGGTAGFNVTVRSLSNTAEAVAVRLSPVPGFWSGSVEPERAQLEPGASSCHTVTVSAPELALAGDRWDLRFRAEGLTGGVLEELALSVEVLPVRSVQLGCDPGEGVALPGENASFKLSARNLGNGPDTIDFSASAPEGWAVSFDRRSLELGYGGSAAVLVKVAPPDHALAGEVRDISLVATSSDGTAASLSVSVEVAQSYGFACSLGSETLTLAPGDESSTVVRVRNLGNGEETFTMSIQAGDIQASLSDPTLSLGAFTEANVTVAVRLPDRFFGDEGKVVITVRPAHSPAEALEVAVAVVWPDLVISREAITVSPPSPVEGQQVTVSVEVRNAGAARTGPFTVRLLEFGLEAGNFSINDLAPGGRATVVFTWPAASPGVHELRLSAEGAFRDPTPADNAASVSVTVAPLRVERPEPPGESGPSTVVIAGAGLLLVAAAALVAAFLLRRRPPERAPPAPDAPSDRSGFSLVGGGRP
ncbi:MAG: TIGR03790 family protein [Euryarchaeota archaeon]|nr:TIGR03790 family protein [Euryarchaeota archaeon]